MTVIDYGSLNVEAFFKKLNNAEYFDINTYILEYLSYHADKLSQESGALVRQASQHAFLLSQTRPYREQALF